MMFGELPEFTRRWTRRHLLETIDDYLQATYNISDWEKKTSHHLKYGNPDMWKKTTYWRDRDHIEIFEKEQFISLEFSVPTIEKKYGSQEYVISFRRTNSPLNGNYYWLGDLFQLNRMDSYNGLRGHREVKSTVDDLIRALQGEMGDSDIERDRKIYDNCVALLTQVAEWAIFRMNIDAEGFKQESEDTGIPLHLPLSPSTICNCLFYGGSQGGTYTREKLSEMIVYDDRNIELAKNIFDCENWDDIGVEEE